jgi:hypothetical protein
MRLINHDDRVLAEQRVEHALAEQHTVREVLYARSVATQVLEADRVAHFIAEYAPDFLRYARGY